MRLIEIVYNHAQFDELAPERIFAPLGLEVHTECHEPPLDEEDEGLEAFDHYARDPQGYIDALSFQLPAGFVEVARYENEDNIVLLALKPLTPLAELLLAQEETGEALAAVARERRRQVDAEGWTAEHDDTHVTGEIAKAAACYALPQDMPRRDRHVMTLWPWDGAWWNPTTDLRNLEKAGALTLAEMERIARAKQREGGAV
ncbi:hypothetical protein F0A16_14100 [Salinicola corii]|uniref:Uncharacterized protein n=1 Tax=Salinicola corii TaxID=2606937 RepID=A0A640WAG5_9GAMM|nr:hypothetical protein [Salinicola corii]KAA0017133.1 hypothetical protein F0A16_14100 [Salinicola corii]